MLHLVESDTENLSGLRHFCISSGFDLLAFDSPLLYLEFVKSPEFSPPVALVTAYHMPLMNGAELAAEVKRIHPRQKIVLTSDFAEREITKQAGESICSYLHQPNFFAKLATLLRVLNWCDTAPEEIDADMLSSVCLAEKNRHCSFHLCKKPGVPSAA